jgi:adenine-specific DNA-methyltransferase
MRFIGSKKPLLPFIEKVISSYCGNDRNKTIGDLFCGTSIVSVLFKKLNYKVIANDNLAFCATMAKASLQINEEPLFSSLLNSREIEHQITNNLFTTSYDKVLAFLNQLPGTEGFIFKEYSPGGTCEKKFNRKYFTDENAKKIDAIRNKIYEWSTSKLLTEAEEALLLTDLLRATNKIANIAGTYGYFMKDWIDARVWRPLTLVRSPIIKSNKEHLVYQMDANELIKKIKCDVLYLDPPYNWRHYGAYYHILETIVKWDNPKIEGMSGLRSWEETKSRYSYRNQALNALVELLKNAKAEHLFLSYNNEGLISNEEICKALSTFGYLSIEEIPYKRYKSNNGGAQEIKVKERIYYVKINKN